MSELADEADSKSVGGNTVWVQVPLPARFLMNIRISFYYSHTADFSIIFVLIQPIEKPDANCVRLFYWLFNKLIITIKLFCILIIYNPCRTIKVHFYSSFTILRFKLNVCNLCNSKFAMITFINKRNFKCGNICRCNNIINIL